MEPLQVRHVAPKFDDPALGAGQRVHHGRARHCQHPGSGVGLLRLGLGGLGVLQVQAGHTKLQPSIELCPLQPRHIRRHRQRLGRLQRGLCAGQRSLCRRRGAQRQLGLHGLDQGVDLVELCKPLDQLGRGLRARLQRAADLVLVGQHEAAGCGGVHLQQAADEGRDLLLPGDDAAVVVDLGTRLAALDVVRDPVSGELDLGLERVDGLAVGDGVVQRAAQGVDAEEGVADAAQEGGLAGFVGAAQGGQAAGEHHLKVAMALEIREFD